jgi:predicted AAA+ superfamily ATPase
MIPELQKEKKNVPTISKKYEELILTRKNEVEKTLATKTKEFKKIILTLGKKVNMPPEHLEGKTLRDLVVTYASVAKLTSCVLPDN